MQSHKPKNSNNEDDPKRFVDEGTDKRNHEHLTNEGDQITDEDIANVKTEVTESKEDPATTDQTASTAESTDVESKGLPEETKLKDAIDPGIETSWNILGS